MPDHPESSNTPKPAKPPSAAELLDSAKRVKSQALYVGTTRLIQESRHLREAAEHARKEAAEKASSRPQNAP